MAKKTHQNKPKYALDRLKRPYFLNFSRGRIPPDPPTKAQALRALGWALRAQRDFPLAGKLSPPLEKSWLRAWLRLI